MKTKTDRIRSQQIRGSCRIQPINEWMKRRRRECDEHVTSMEAESLFKIPRENTRAQDNPQDFQNEDGVTVVKTSGIAYIRKKK